MALMAFKAFVVVAALDFALWLVLRAGALSIDSLEQKRIHVGGWRYMARCHPYLWYPATAMVALMALAVLLLVATAILWAVGA